MAVSPSSSPRMTEQKYSSRTRQPPGRNCDGRDNLATSGRSDMGMSFTTAPRARPSPDPRMPRSPPVDTLMSVSSQVSRTPSAIVEQAAVDQRGRAAIPGIIRADAEVALPRDDGGAGAGVADLEPHHIYDRDFIAYFGLFPLS